MAGVAFAVEGDGVGFATESYAASALYTTLASLSAAPSRIRRVSSANLMHRHSGMVRRTRPGISRFRVRFAPRNDESYRTSSLIAPSRPSIVIGYMRSDNSRRMMVVDSE